MLQIWPIQTNSIKKGNSIFFNDFPSVTRSLFHFRDTIYISSIIKHDKFSTREGYPTVIQIIVPPYLAYKEDIDTFTSNYTSNGNENVTVAVTNPSTVHFQFPQGISFPDIVELNFSMTVEMEGNRPVGSGVQSSSIVFVPICFHSGNDYIGDANSSVVSCGSLHALPFESSAPGEIQRLWISQLYFGPIAWSGLYKQLFNEPVRQSNKVVWCKGVTPLTFP